MRGQILPKLIAIVCFFCSDIGFAQIISPVPVAQWPHETRGIPGRLSFDGDRLYVSTLEGVVVVDISNPAQMRRVSMFNGYLRPAVVSLVPGKLILQQDLREHTIHIRDVEDLLNPIDLTTLPGDFAAASWPYAYICGTNGIVVWDCTNPKIPAAAGSINTSSSELFSHGNILVSISSQNQFEFFDITDRTAPKHIDSPPNFATQQIAFDGNLAYLSGDALGYLKLQIVDVSVPGQLKKIAEWDGYSSPIAVADGVLVFATDYDYRIWDISNPLQRPTEIGVIAKKPRTNVWRGLCAFHNGKLFVTDYYDLRCYDVSDPRHPVVLGSLHFQTDVWSLAKSGDRLYAAQDGEGVQVFDLTNPADPRPLKSSLPEARSIDAVGSNIFLFDFHCNFQIYNAADPANPHLTASIPVGCTSPSPGLVVVGDLAFIYRDNTIQAIDISTPTNPTIRTNIGGTPFGPAKIVHAQGLIYAFDGGLLKIINAQTTELLSEVQTESAVTFSVIGPAVYVGQSIYDCSDPRNPTFKSQVPLEQCTIVTEVRGAYVPGATNRLFSCYGYSLIELDVSDPFSPKMLSFMRNRGSDLLAAGDFLYMPYGGYLVTFQIFGQTPTLPSLNISSYSETHRVRWPKRFDGFKLLTAPTLSGPWTLNTRTVFFTDFNFEYEVAVPSRDSGLFYKLEN